MKIVVLIIVITVQEMVTAALRARNGIGRKILANLSVLGIALRMLTLTSSAQKKIRVSLFVVVLVMSLIVRLVVVMMIAVFARSAAAGFVLTSQFALLVLGGALTGVLLLCAAVMVAIGLPRIDF